MVTGKMEMHISDIHRKTYLENQFKGSEQQIDTSHLSAGIYAIHLSKNKYSIIIATKLQLLYFSLSLK